MYFDNPSVSQTFKSNSKGYNTLSSQTDISQYVYISRLCCIVNELAQQTVFVTQPV